MSKPLNSFSLTFIHDPLCGWCFAIQPQLEQLMVELRDHLSLKSLVAGLFVGDKAPIVGEGMFEHLHRGMPEVESLSSVRFGEPFRSRIVGDPNYIYETGQACRAVVAAEKISPDKVLGFVHGLQNAFFVEGKDANSTGTFAEVATQTLSVSNGEYLDIFESKSCQEECERQFSESRSLLEKFGRETMPALLLGHSRTSEKMLIDHERHRTPSALVEHVRQSLGQLDLVSMEAFT